MSSAAAAHQMTGSKAIPSRRIAIHSPSQLPGDYSQTPGGTLFSTTPGGTRIIYDRSFLLNCRNSPLAKSPPPNLPKIPGVTSPTIVEETTPHKQNGIETITEETVKAGGAAGGDDPQFDMDI